MKGGDMGKIENFTGLAGELRVMSELLLRGHNPAKSYLDNGIDLFLENGKKLQVRSGRLRKSGARRYECIVNKKPYGIHKKKGIVDEIDFLIFWCIDYNTFYIFPKQVIEKLTAICIIPDKQKQRNSWYEKYQEKWELLLQE